MKDQELQFIQTTIQNNVNELVTEVKRLRDKYEPVVPMLKIAIPTYFYPGALWTSLNGQNCAIAIINPGSGPGTKKDQNYADTVTAAKAKGMMVLGYVTSSYAKKSASNFNLEVNDYYSWYPNLDGIFIDECSVSLADVSWYNLANAFIKTKGGKGLTVINPGTLIPEAYVNSADIIMNFESTADVYTKFTPMGWEAKYPKDKFWHLIHTCPPSQLPTVMAKAKTQTAGYVYVTPDTMPNPWDTLPPTDYFTQELALR